MEANLVRQQGQELTNPTGDSAPAATVQVPANLSELDQLLMEHARQSTSLALSAGEIKANWLAFTEQAPVHHVLGALKIVAQVGRIRGELVDETIRIAEILHGVERARTSFNVGEAAVLVVPSVRRRSQAE
jgi:uncharacterized protein YaaQ